MIGFGGGVKTVTILGLLPFIAEPPVKAVQTAVLDPQNLIIVNTYDVRIRKTDSDVRSIMEDKRFYVVHSDFDSIIEELDATAIIENMDLPAPPVGP